MNRDNVKIKKLDLNEHKIVGWKLDSEKIKKN